jgi:hypothetical protein
VIKAGKPIRFDVNVQGECFLSNFEIIDNNYLTIKVNHLQNAFGG